ncbi:MAG: cell division protein FtsZ [Treponema sp.]|jgi:cell division protein FtsZ|nr:cell division protein FtsZ [Treponema sp.]
MNIVSVREEEPIPFPNDSAPVPALIKVIGAGGGGSNAVDRMIECGLSGVEFITMNTDIQDLHKNKASTRIQIGSKLTGGRGAGGKPEIGEKAANEDLDKIKEVVKDTDMVFVTAGMGGGTGTGSAPVIARAAREAGALTVGVVTKPFDSEGRYKMKLAEEGIKKLREAVDTLIVIPNQFIFKIIDRQTPLKAALVKADEVLRQGVQGISDIITTTGLFNPDFADVEATMKGQGDALMGIGYGTGENRAIDAATNAIDNPLLEDTTIEGATRLLINITGSEELSAVEMDEAVNYIKAKADADVEVILGVCIDPLLGDQIRVTVIATGFQNGSAHSAAKEPLEVKPRENDFIRFEEWDKIRTQSKSLPPRNYQDVDLEVPTVIRDRTCETGHQDAGHRDVLGL